MEKVGFYIMHMRHSQLLNIVNQKKRVAVTELAKALDVSEVTVRKDLNLLEQKGLLRREHGYAAMTASDDIANHLSFNYERKRLIAHRAAESIHNGETVMIESGGCCALLAEELAANRRDITIITNSAFIADFIRKQPNAHVILLGGEYQNESQVMVGPMIRNCVKDFYVNHSLLVLTDSTNRDSCPMTLCGPRQPEPWQKVLVRSSFSPSPPNSNPAVLSPCFPWIR